MADAIAIPTGWRRHWRRFVCRLRRAHVLRSYVHRTPVTRGVTHRWRITRCDRCGALIEMERIGKRTADRIAPRRNA